MDVSFAVPRIMAFVDTFALNQELGNNKNHSLCVQCTVSADPFSAERNVASCRRMTTELIAVTGLSQNNPVCAALRNVECIARS